ncbi:MAG: PD-(D/E)XK nuclease family protein [Ignavibacteria bacterium]|nr:PD-(D/E)XK nuclease family protein [Ignavibacteria bacterium]
MGFVVCNETFLQKYPIVFFDEFVQKIIEEWNPSDFYFVSATNQLAWNFKLTFAENYFQAIKKPLINFTISNPEGFVKRFFDALKPKGIGKVLSDSYRFLVFKEAFDRAKLSFFKQENQRTSLYVIKWLSQIIFGLKEDGINVENFEREISQENESIINLPKFLDTKVLFEEYQSLLKESNLFDIVDATIFCANYLNNYLQKESLINHKPKLPIFSEKTFLFFGFYDFKVPEIEFITSLSRYQNPLAIFLDFDETNGPLFGNYNDLIIQLKSRGFLSISLEKNSSENNTNFLKKYLFNNIFGKSREELAKNIHIYATENKFNEVKQIAKLCKYLISVEGYKPSEICITTKEPQSYASLFREAFNEANVPVNIMERYKLSSSPLVISILSALDVVARGFRFKDIRKVLLSFYFRFGKLDSSGKFIPIDIENFINISTKMKCLGGKELGGKNYWIRRFKNRIKVVEDRINFLKSATYPDSMELYSLEEEKRLLEKANTDFITLLDYFDFDKEEITIEEFYDIVFNKIIQRFGIFRILEDVINNLLNTIEKLDKYDKISRIEEVEKDSRALAKFLELLEEFTYITSKRFPGKRYTLTEILELFKVVIFEERYQISRKPEYGVTVTTIEQTRGIPYKVIILCGAVDGIIPFRYSPERFLGRTLGKSEKRHFENERLEFFFFLTNNPSLFNENQRKTYIFYPKRDSKKEFVPSPFIFSLLDLLGKKKEDVLIDLTHKEINRFSGIDWFWTVVSNVEKNIKFSKVNENWEDKNFSNYITNLYFQKIQSNALDFEKLTKNTQDFFNTITSKPISITFLEEYNRCPFRFFVNRVLNIEEPKVDLEIFLTNREKGELLHLIVSNFYKKLAEESLKRKDNLFTIQVRNRTYVPVLIDEQKRNEYFELIEKITKSILERYNTEISLFEIDFEEFFSSEPQRIGLVQLWLNYELKRSPWEHFPTFFEFSFGLGNKDSYEPIEIELENGEIIKLKGKIDRVDLCLTDDGIEFSIIDYKLSRSEVPSPIEIILGLSFQMPFYAMAFKDFIEKNLKYQVYSINLLYQIFNFKPIKGEDKDSLNFVKFFVSQNSKLSVYFTKRRHFVNEVIDEAFFYTFKIKALNTINNIKRKLEYPVKPASEYRFCKNCQFKSICKKEIY